jgi:methionyl-tRNA synthetase
MPETKKFYLTTPIYYVNARPHIGHAYSTIVADVLARRHRLLGEEVYFLTGTDEHGQKIERSAAAAGIPPQQFADQVSKTFADLWKRMGITNDQFIRTTSEKHKVGVQKLFATLYERGHIYLDTYTGSYCVSDEAFVDAPVGTPCPDCGRLLEEVTEENFFFRLSAFQDKLIHLIESGELTITPDSSRNEVLSFIRGGLKDLSISRSSFTWGIPVPEEVQKAAGATQKHVIYVWLDALANYMTALGYGSADESLWQKFWPADLHLVGKEITRFHCVYWPAFLMAAGLPVPKQVTANGWLLFDNSKMSKSKGNVVRAETILDAFGTLCPVPPTASGAEQPLPQGLNPAASVEDSTYGLKPVPFKSELGTELLEASAHDRDLFAADVLRYYLLREIPFGQDGSFSFDSLITRYNADLANGYGNLVSRTFKMISNYFGDLVPEIDSEIIEKVITLANLQATFAWKEEFLAPLYRDFQDLRFDRYLQGIEVFISVTDETISTMAPWKPKATEELTTENRQYSLVYSWQMIRIITALLYPILPYATARVWAQLGLGDIEAAAREGKLTNLQWGGLEPGTKLGPLGPIFPRADKGLAQMMMDNEERLAAGSLNTQIPSGNDKQEGHTESTDPGAPPRTSSLPEPGGTLTVGGSHAHTTGPEPAHAPVAPSNLESPSLESPQITIDDFAKLDLRVAQIVLAERIPKADKLLRLEVDLGPLGKRQILSGIAEFYTPEELTGRRIVVIANLAPRKMRGLESHGMLLAASDGDHGKPHLATCGDEIALGARLK